MTIKHYPRALFAPLLPALDELARAARYPNAGLDEIAHAFVAYDGDKPVAYSGLACYHGYWCLRVCVVHPAYRGRGLQRQLIRARFRFLRAKRIPHVNVWVALTNTYSLNNLVAEGFRFLPEKPRPYAGVDHVKLRAIL